MNSHPDYAAWSGDLPDDERDDERCHECGAAAGVACSPTCECDACLETLRAE